MGQKTVIAFGILIINCFHRVQSNELKIITNCTLDDLRNINADSKKITSTAVDFVFSHCSLFTLPDAFFVNVSSVRSIDFCSSEITSINPNALSGLNELQVLRIVENPSLTQLELWTPRNLVKLIELDLHKNGINKLEVNALRRYPNIKRLDLQGNAIQEIPIGFLDLSFNLETLNLAENSIQRIESDTFKALLRLCSLNLSNNHITYIDSYAFTTTTRLKTLQLNGNQIKTINSMVFFNLAQLEYLNLSANALSGYALDEDAFKQNSQLLHLDVSHNEMVSILPNALKGLHSLQVLNASNNQMVSIALKDLGNLTHLDVSMNKLTHLLDNQFAFMASIQSINISHNELSSIQPFTLTDLKTLKTLDLSANHLHTDDFLNEATAIKTIHLQNNEYNKINLSAFKSVGRVHLNNNPWNCSWLLNALANKEHQITNIQFGFEFDGVEHGNLTLSLIEELECLDYRKSLDNPITRRIVIVNSDNCKSQKNSDNEKKKRPVISTYPRTFNKLLSDEFDFKACLLWSVGAVFLVIGLVRFGKYCLDKSEKKSERYRIVQQEKVLKDIDDYFAKNNRRQRT